MVVTRQSSQMDPEKNKDKNEVNRTGTEKSRMNSTNKNGNNSNTDSEDDHDSVHSSPRSSHSSNAPVPSGLPGSPPLKVTIKKNKSYSSSSRESAQPFEVVKNSLPPAESPCASSEEDGEDQKVDSENDKNSDKPNSEDDVADDAAENEKESEPESENANESCDSDLEIVEGPILNKTINDKKESKPFIKKDSNIPETSSVTNFKSEEVPQNSVIKKEEKVVKNEDKEDLKDSILENKVLVLKKDESKDLIKEQQKEYKLNVRSFVDLAAPQTINLINMPPPSQIDSPSNFISQNGSPYPQYMNMSCDLCTLQFDSLELLNEHKKVMKHYKCSFKDCEHLILSSQQEFLDHQSMVHNIMPSPVQQLAHQVQRLPTMGFDQQLQPVVPPLPENLQPPGVPNMYTQPLRMPNQVPMQRSMRPMGRPNMNLMMGGAPRGRNMTRAPRGRSVAMSSPMMRGTPLKRPLSSMGVRHQTPPLKRVATDRSDRTSFTKNSPTIVKSLSESLTKSITSANKSQANHTQQDVVNLFSKRGLTISTVDTVNNISIPAGLSLNSAVSIIPTSPAKTVDTVDLTGPDSRPKKFWPCEICSKTYLSVETLYEHVSAAHKTVQLSYKCNLCSLSFPSGELLYRHKQSFHKTDVNTNSQFVIPIMDISKNGSIARMNAMGITNYMPLAQMEQQNGQFAFPIMSTARPGSMDGLKFTHFLSLGCIRKL
ncbi:Hypothetical protein CINCED_3A002219 [Cinara cedri]|uniref:C2H2-type domain-containing protein n=1 Tax=Cinara cedri TaxID=506608 RepID=A0A5E4NE86_9HEMI|nr:Hypothetical protein CINCED_3A002219 [Cinara cedri]